MTTLLYTHPACFMHNPGSEHPETPERLKAVLDALDAPVFDALVRREAPRVERADLLRVHTEDYVDSVFAAVPASGTAELDPETVLSAGSGEAASRAAGAVCAAVDAVIAGEGRNAFCAIRPPGHHAERDRAMGFCLFNNILIGALHARDVHGMKRVAIIDFDVHHGNGTQYSMEHDATVFYGSTHQARIFPATGLAKETGVGNVVNRVLPPGAGSGEFRTAFSEWIFPELGHFAPDMLFVSAGFDGHEGDPLADLRLTEADYTWVTQQLVSFAERYCGGRLVSTLEGGYDPDALAASAAAHVMALMGV